MNHRWFAGAIVAVFVLLGASFAVACNDDGGELTLEKYFERVDEIDNKQQEKSDTLDEEMTALEEGDVDGFIDLFEQQVDLIEDLADDLDGLDPPSAVADTHDATVSNLRKAVDQFRKALDDAGDAETSEELIASFDTADFSAIEAANQNCRELEQTAVENEITVDLDCDDE